MASRFSLRAALLAPACALLIGAVPASAIADPGGSRPAGLILAQDFDRDDAREWRRERREERREFRRDRRDEWRDRREDFFDRRQEFFDRRFGDRGFRGFRDGGRFDGDFDRHRHRFDRRFDRRHELRRDHRFGRGFPPRRRGGVHGGPPWIR